MSAIREFLFSLVESWGIHSKAQLIELLTRTGHGSAFATHRAKVTSDRVFFFTAVFVLLFPAWIAVDFFTLPKELATELAALRVAATALFLTLAWQCHKHQSIKRSLVLLGSMFAVTLLFYLVSEWIFSSYELEGLAEIAHALYGLFPFIIVFILALFPLTVREYAVYGLFILLGISYVVYPQCSAGAPEAIATLWLIILMLSLSLFSAIGQLRYMLSQVSRASFDPLTNVLTKRAGIESIELQSRVALLRGGGIAVIFLDLDRFDAVNEAYGLDAGDVVLKEAAKKLRSVVRKSDSVVRWEGEKFLLILPGAEVEAVMMITERLMKHGLGNRPDGSIVTASMGIAETHADNAENWKQLVEAADKRMYDAKNKGRARVVSCDGSEALWPDPDYISSVYT